jgi:hypothetical protein
VTDITEGENLSLYVESVKIMTLKALVVALVLSLASPRSIHAQEGRKPYGRWDLERQEELDWRVSISRLKNIESSERKRLVEVITDALRDAGVVRDGFASEEQLPQVAAETRIKYIDLNGDGKPEVVAQAGGERSGCSPTGNCPFWIFHRQGESYEILLEGEGQTFAVQRTRTKGLLDIVLSRHGSAFDSEARTYSFDGESYREGSCFDVEWSAVGSDDGMHQLKKPRMSPCRSR